MKGPGELQILSVDIQCGPGVTSSGSTAGNIIVSPKLLPISRSYPNTAYIATTLTIMVGKTSIGGHHTHPPKSQWSQSLC